MNETHVRQELMPTKVADPHTAGHYVVSMADDTLWRIKRVWKEPDEVRPRSQIFDLTYRHRSLALQQCHAWVGIHS